MSKRLFRDRENRILGGVAGGIGSYFGIDPLFVRLAFIVLSLFNGVGALVYALLWLLVPNSDSVYIDARAQVQENIDDIKGTAQSLFERIRSAFNGI